MQELYQVIKERFARLEYLLNTKLTTQQYQKLKQQQKQRCEKQTSILSIFRSKRSHLNTHLKANYFKYSLQIMKTIEPNFIFQSQPNLNDQTFLNDFVCLYTKFFDYYDNKFQFKVKIRNLLRPTNHNIVNDLIKYLSDFSRDYCQHIYLWQFKNLKKEQTQQNGDSTKRLSLSQPQNQQNSMRINNPSNYSSVVIKQKQKLPNTFRASLNLDPNANNSYTSISPSKRYPLPLQQKQNNQNDLQFKKSEYKQIYNILDIQTFPIFVYTDKTKFNTDILKLRMNELYRDIKHRNNLIKSAITLYYNTYHMKYNSQIFNNLSNNINNKTNYLQDAHPHISHPYRISLVIEKNGYSCINVTTIERRYSEKQRNLSPIKDKIRSSSLSSKDGALISQLMGNMGNAKISSSRNDFVLNSLKILRVSENFLPSIIRTKQTARLSSEQEQRQQANIIRMPSSNQGNTFNLEVQNGKQQQIKASVCYYNQQLFRDAQRRKQQKRRLSQMKKHFTSDDRKKNKQSIKNDPQGKITEWLDKINIMKQLERKKILGLN